MNLTVIHYFFLFCSSMATGIPLMADAFPPQASPWLKASAAVFGLLALVSGAFAPSVSNAETLKTAAKLGATRIVGALLLVGAMAFGTAEEGCAAFQKALPYLPTPKTLACVADDVEKGVENPITIVSDCPDLAVVAMVDVEALVTDLLMAKRAQHMAAMRAGAAYCGDGGVRTLNFANDNDAGRDGGAK